MCMCVFFRICPLRLRGYFSICVCRIWECVCQWVYMCVCVWFKMLFWLFVVSHLILMKAATLHDLSPQGLLECNNNNNAITTTSIKLRHINNVSASLASLSYSHQIISAYANSGWHFDTSILESSGFSVLVSSSKAKICNASKVLQSERTF